MKRQNTNAYGMDRAKKTKKNYLSKLNALVVFTVVLWILTAAIFSFINSRGFIITLLMELPIAVGFFVLLSYLMSLPTTKSATGKRKSQMSAQAGKQKASGQAKMTKNLVTTGKMRKEGKHQLHTVGKVTSQERTGNFGYRSTRRECRPIKKNYNWVLADSDKSSLKASSSFKEHKEEAAPKKFTPYRSPFVSSVPPAKNDEAKVVYKDSSIGAANPEKKDGILEKAGSVDVAKGAEPNTNLDVKAAASEAARDAEYEVGMENSVNMDGKISTGSTCDFDNIENASSTYASGIMYKEGGADDIGSTYTSGIMDEPSNIENISNTYASGMIDDPGSIENISNTYTTGVIDGPGSMESTSSTHATGIIDDPGSMESISSTYVPEIIDDPGNIQDTGSTYASDIDNIDYIDSINSIDDLTNANEMNVDTNMRNTRDAPIPADWTNTDDAVYMENILNTEYSGDTENTNDVGFQAYSNADDADYIEYMEDLAYMTDEDTTAYGGDIDNIGDVENFEISEGLGNLKVISGSDKIDAESDDYTLYGIAADDEADEKAFYPDMDRPQEKSDIWHVPEISSDSEAQYLHMPQVSKGSVSQHRYVTEASNSSGSQYGYALEASKGYETQQGNATGISKDSEIRYENTPEVSKVSEVQHRHAMEASKAPGVHHSYTTELSKGSGTPYGHGAESLKDSVTQKGYDTEALKAPGVQHGYFTEASKAPGTLYGHATEISKNAGPQHVMKAAVKLNDYALPPLDLLESNNIKPDERATHTQVEQNAKKLVDTLASFGVGAKVVNISKGPAVTRYELQPNVGVKVSKIVNLADDIALNLAATGVRIEAPIPGKAAVGIEVPNKEVTPVFLREVVESDEFIRHPSRLSFAVGKDIAGKTVVADIAKMPHLLIAGATGSGKSVCINTLIASILYKASPAEVKLLMVDPKVVELSIYNGIPHLLIPVVTDPKKAAGALNWAVVEMTNRYKMFAENNVRDLKGYNSLLAQRGESTLPQIVIIIDELADLMMAAPNDVEDCICRLAQMARAAGMHLVIATQRPSVDVITGVIKANIPSRISFAVSSQIDSRTILDMAGAEKLLGRGDMLFCPISAPKPIRVQGAFISDREVESIVSYIKSRYDMTEGYDDEILARIESQTESRAQNESDDEDELLTQAIDIVIEQGHASTSLIQRKLKVGYARAARIVDQMEALGIVGPPEGSKPRQLKITKQEWQEMNS